MPGEKDGGWSAQSFLGLPSHATSETKRHPTGREFSHPVLQVANYFGYMLQSRAFSPILMGGFRPSDPLVPCMLRNFWKVAGLITCTHACMHACMLKGHRLTWNYMERYIICHVSVPCMFLHDARVCFRYSWECIRTILWRRSQRRNAACQYQSCCIWMTGVV